MTDKTPIQKLADRIAEEATKPETKLSDAVDALKALTGWHTVLQKRRSPAKDDSEDESSFDDFRAELASADEGHNGSTAMAPRGDRGRRGRADS